MRNETLVKRLERIIADVALFLAILFCPWWITATAVFFGIVYFRNFYEAFFAGLFIDALYGTSEISFYGFHLFFSAGFLLLYSVVQFFKEKMRL